MIFFRGSGIPYKKPDFFSHVFFSGGPLVADTRGILDDVAS